MEEELKKLLELAEVDKKIFELRQSRKDLPLRIQRLGEEIQREKERYESIQNAVEDTKRKIKENQDSIVTEQEALNHSNEKLDNISTNREYDAVHSEIAIHKKNIDNAQTNVIHFQQILENHERDLENASKEFERVKEANEPALAKLTEELNGIEDKVSAQKTKAKKPREQLSRRILMVYDRTSKRRGNPYVISLINRDQKACEICNRTQTPQTINDVAKKSTLMTCEGCGSILIWKDEEMVSNDSK